MGAGPQETIAQAPKKAKNKYFLTIFNDFGAISALF
jgi:hypothetical protein